MATTIAKYVEKCNEVYEAQPAYVKGASDLTECDCIGMDKYAFRKCDVPFSTTGTNYSYRNQIDNARAISSASDLHVGDVVFKAYEPGESGYDLPAKYQPGGSGYNGDLRDYCHIGTVKSVSPLQIIHMTSPSAKQDTKIGKWRFAGNWKPQYISDDPGPEPTPPGPEPEPPTPEPDKAVVYADNGQPVKMRAKPSSNCKLYWKVPCGTILDVLDWGDTWSNVRGQTEDGYQTGYMMRKFLKPVDQPDPVPSDALYTVCIQKLTYDQAQELVKQYPGSWMIEEVTVG